MNDEIEIDIWVNDEHFASVSGRRDQVMAETMHYLSLQKNGDEIRLVKVTRTPITISELL